MRVLVLDSALARRLAAVVEDGTILVSRSEPGNLGHESALPEMARAVLIEAGGLIPPEAGGHIDLVAAIVGPGSFTGIRAGLALAHGIGLARGVPVIGVTLGEAIAIAYPGKRDLWVVTASRRGFIFLETSGSVLSLALTDLPLPRGPVALAGPEAKDIASRLAARGADVLLTDSRFPNPLHIADMAARRAAGTVLTRPAQPLYVDPPEARLPAGGLRPPPLASRSES